MPGAAGCGARGDYSRIRGIPWCTSVRCRCWSVGYGGKKGLLQNNKRAARRWVRTRVIPHRHVYCCGPFCGISFGGVVQHKHPNAGMLCSDYNRNATPRALRQTVYSEYSATENGRPPEALLLSCTASSLLLVVLVPSTRTNRGSATHQDGCMCVMCHTNDGDWHRSRVQR